MKFKVELNREEVAKTLSGVKEKLPDGVKDFAREVTGDIDAICQRDPAVKSRAEAALLYSGLHAILLYRVSNKFYKKGNY